LNRCTNTGIARVNSANRKAGYKKCIDADWMCYKFAKKTGIKQIYQIIGFFIPFCTNRFL
jgi:hypothetical protein